MNPFVLCLGLCLLTASHVLAARAPDDPSKADHVVTGKVEKIFTRERGGLTGYFVQIRLETIEKGAGNKPQDVMHVSCYQRKPDVFAIGQDPGHVAIPKEGQSIKAVVHRRKSGILEGNFPDGFEEELVESEILKAELKTLIDEMTKAGKPIPAGNDTKRLIEETRKSYPAFLRISPEAEARWKMNQFDEDGAKRRIKAAIETLGGFGVEIADWEVVLIKEHDSGKLQGARRELAIHVLEARVATFLKKLMRD